MPAGRSPRQRAAGGGLDQHRHRTSPMPGRRESLWHSFGFGGVVPIGRFEECQKMAKSAINELQQQIEAIRGEAFAAGYAAAMASIREFTGKPAPAPKTFNASRRKPDVAEPKRSTPPSRLRQRAAARTTQRTRQAPAPRLQRGNNARLVEEILQANAPRALRPAEIRTVLQRDKGVAVAFTSLRHALLQLQARASAEPSDDGKSWRYRAGGAAA